MAEESRLKFTVTGFFYPFKGMRFLIANPSLFSLIAVPIAINTMLYSLFIWYASSRLGGWIEYFVQRGEGWYWSILYYILFFIAAAIILIAVIYTFTLTGNLILAPFNDLLSQKVESIYSGEMVDGSFGAGDFFRDILRSYRAEGGRIILYAGLFLALLPLNLLPLAGTALYGVLFVICSLFFLCWEFFDYSMERWRFSFRVKRRLAFRNVFVFISFGAGSALLLMIPLVNLAAIPLCVAGATLLFCDLRKSGSLPE